MSKVKARRVQMFTMIVTGFDPATKKKQLKVAGRKYAIWLQDQTANLFKKEASVGGKLGKNSKAWNDFKASNGFETTRGHMTGNTQDVLDTKRLYTVDVRGTKKKPRVIIFFSRKTFYNEVGGIVNGKSYIEHYEENKVPGDLIMALKSGWARNAPRFFKGL